MRPNIAFDVDGIVANFSAAFKTWVLVKYGYTCIETKNFHWRVEPAMPDVAIKNIVAEFIREHSNIISSLKDGAALVRYVWAKTARPITFVTARHFSTVQATNNWIHRHFIDIDYVIITVPSGSDKWRFIDDFDCFVDDRRKTAIDLSRRGKIVFLPDRYSNDLWYGGKPNDLLTFSSTSKLIQKGSIVTMESCDELLDGRVDRFIFKP